ncbi:aldo/keto reductase [Pajaroellobacter abortibovis]|uniref:NADP-dependent oxidoreductase domain-containing protein n=1 Tax=Pajaroellobacter abortibovis TaxID=1882918 RepID=A0A1L6MY75_9BACT|nr:aldo/keto reductase [Pajaroellobacter abortibovis]APS00446.1 hypothetical protein BCY86_06975 [Pajaroellobacter abortibovis]
MKTRILGKTGKSVSQLALGTWAFSGETYGAMEPTEAKRIVLQAVEQGISLIETSDSYGAGQVQMSLGEWLSSYPHVQIATRIGIDLSTEPARKNFTPAYLRLAVARSCKRLRKEQLDFCLLHNPSWDTLKQGKATHALTAMQQEGRIAHWGVSVDNAKIGQAAVAQGAELIELPFNLFHPHDFYQLAQEVKEKQIGILARSILNFGLLVGLWSMEHTFPQEDHRCDRWNLKSFQRRLKQIHAFRFLIKDEVHSLRAASIRFVLSHPLVSSAVIGPRNILQLEQLLRDMGQGSIYLPDEDLQRLRQLFFRTNK